MEPLVKVLMTEEDARLFLLFQKHYLFIAQLEKIKAFDIRNGNIKIHFDYEGAIRTIDKFESHRLEDMDRWS